MLLAGLMCMGIALNSGYDSRISVGAKLVDVPIFTQEFVSNFLAMQAGAYYKLPWWIGPTRDTTEGTVVEKKGWGFTFSAGYRNSWLYIGPVIGVAYQWDAFQGAYVSDTSFVCYGGAIGFKLDNWFLDLGYNTGRGPYAGVGRHIYFPGDYD